MARYPSRSRPDGIHWADEGAEIAIPGKPRTSFGRIVQLGNWLRLVATLPVGAERRLVATLNLKGLAHRTPSPTSSLVAGQRGRSVRVDVCRTSAGRHVMINALTHGNEPCGAAAVIRLLDRAVRPTRGRLTFGFASVEAFAVHCAGTILRRALLDRDLNRLWRDN
jgi:hypothetical protein